MNLMHHGEKVVHVGCRKLQLAKHNQDLEIRFKNWTLDENVNHYCLYPILTSMNVVPAPPALQL